MVHRVGHDQLRGGALIDDPHLHFRGPVGQEEELALAIVLGQDGVELGHHVQVQAERLAVVHVRQIAAAPAEGLAAGDDLQAGRVDRALLEHLQMLRRPILADHARQADRSEEAGRIGKEHGRTAQHVVALPVRGRFHAIQGNRTHNHQRHRNLLNLNLGRPSAANCRDRPPRRSSQGIRSLSWNATEGVPYNLFYFAAPASPGSQEAR